MSVIPVGEWYELNYPNEGVDYWLRVRIVSLDDDGKAAWVRMVADPGNSFPVLTSELRSLPAPAGDVPDSDPCQDLRLMLMRIIQRHQAGRDLTETLDGAADLLRRQGRVFRDPALAGDVPGEAQTSPDSTAQGDGTSREGGR